MRNFATFAFALFVVAATAGLAGAQEQTAPLGMDLPFKQNDAFKAVQATADTRGVKLGDRYPTKCDRASASPDALYFCEYAFYGTRVRFWSTSADTAVGLISARPLSHATTTYWIVSLSLLIGTIDSTLTNDEIQAIAEKVTSAGRSLGGSKTAIGVRGFYMAHVGRDGLTFMASSAPKP